MDPPVLDSDSVPDDWEAYDDDDAIPIPIIAPAPAVAEAPQVNAGAARDLAAALLTLGVLQRTFPDFAEDPDIDRVLAPVRALATAERAFKMAYQLQQKLLRATVSLMELPALDDTIRALNKALKIPLSEFARVVHEDNDRYGALDLMFESIQPICSKFIKWRQLVRDQWNRALQLHKSARVTLLDEWEELHATPDHRPSLEPLEHAIQLIVDAVIEFNEHAINTPLKPTRDRLCSIQCPLLDSVLPVKHDTSTTPSDPVELEHRPSLEQALGTHSHLVTSHMSVLQQVLEHTNNLWRTRYGRLQRLFEDWGHYHSNTPITSTPPDPFLQLFLHHFSQSFVSYPRCPRDFSSELAVEIASQSTKQPTLAIQSQIVAHLVENIGNCGRIVRRTGDWTILANGLLARLQHCEAASLDATALVPVSDEDRALIFSVVRDLLRYPELRQSWANDTNHLAKLLSVCLQRNVQESCLDLIDNYQSPRLTRSHETLASNELLALEYSIKTAATTMQKDATPVSFPVCEFHPDQWQVQVLAEIEAERSCFVVAPTSLGKSFIAYEAIRSVFGSQRPVPSKSREFDQVVLVAPTSELALQMQAECRRRFPKLTIGVATMAARSNETTGHVLISTPAFMDVLMLSPSYRCSVRIRYIVFDEVQAAGDSSGASDDEEAVELQESYTRLIQTAAVACPFIALSATISDPNRVHRWLCSLSHPKAVTMIIPDQLRWSDLIPYRFDPSTRQLTCFHPLALVPIDTIDATETRELLERFRQGRVLLAPQHVMDLAVALQQELQTAGLQDSEYWTEATLPVDWRLTRRQCFEWQIRLLSVILSLLDSHPSVVRETLSSLANNAKPCSPPAEAPLKPCAEWDLLATMRDQGMLPALVFLNGPTEAELAAANILEAIDCELVAPVKPPPKSPPPTRSSQTLEEEEDWKLSQVVYSDPRELQAYQVKEHLRSLLGKPTLAPFLGLEGMRSLLLEDTELTYWIERVLKQTGWSVNHPILQALYCGVGVYHSSLRKGFRELVSFLFRRRAIQVIVTTRALATGVNVPARTSVIWEREQRIDPMYYQQMAGRAGRRGLDEIGHVVLVGYSRATELRLLTCPEFKLEFARTDNPVAILRLLSLAACLARSRDDPKKPAAAHAEPLCGPALSNILYRPFQDIPAIDAELSLRFSVEMMYRMELLNRRGAPIGAAPLVLRTNELSGNAGFLLAFLLRMGVLDRLCFNVASKAPVDQRARPDPEAHSRIMDFLAWLLYAARVPKGRISDKAKSAVKLYHRFVVIATVSILAQLQPVPEGWSPPDFGFKPAPRSFGKCPLLEFYQGQVPSSKIDNVTYLFLGQVRMMLWKLATAMEVIYGEDYLSFTVPMVFLEVAQRFQARWNLV